MTIMELVGALRDLARAAEEIPHLTADVATGLRALAWAVEQEALRWAQAALPATVEERVAGASRAVPMEVESAHEGNDPMEHGGDMTWSLPYAAAMTALALAVLAWAVKQGR